jgi:LAS superfamily LD-carboxypeptidase LdcB
LFVFFGFYFLSHALSARIVHMNMLGKIILFFLICIAIGLGLGYVAHTYFGTPNILTKTAQAPLVTEPEPVAPVVTEQQTLPDQNSTITDQIAPSTDQSSETSPDQAAEVPTATSPVPVKPKPVITCLKPTDPKQADLWLTPVGPDVSIGDYIPNHLVVLHNYVPTTTATICLTKEAATALASMVAAMHKQNLYPIVASGFRSSTYQDGLHTTTNTVTNGYSSVALPGHSEHQLGMAVDFIGIPDKTTAYYSSLGDFGKTADYTWLAANAASYGFVQSYQSGKEPITGYIPEPWHWRYVGVDNAQAIVASGLAPVQYLENLQKQNQKPDTTTTPASPSSNPSLNIPMPAPQAGQMQ